MKELILLIAIVPTLCLAAPQDPATTDASGRKFAERTPAKPLRVLLAGAGTSHDFPKFFLGMDAKTLQATGSIDESYHPTFAPAATVEWLAENAPDKTGKSYPSVWIVKDPKTRIVCITLGHAAEAHDNPAFQTLLVNSVNWAAGR